MAAMNIQHLRPLVEAAIAAALALPALTAAQAAGPAPAPETGGADVAADLRMAAEAAPFRETADAFVARAMAGDAEAALAMLSPGLVQRSGADALRQVLRTQILPFFAQGAQVGRSVTISRTTDADGRQGFAYYMWLVPKAGGEPQPFSLYVLRDGSRRVIGNVVPNRAVPGRHR